MIYRRRTYLKSSLWILGETKSRWPPSPLNSLTISHLYPNLPSASGALRSRIHLSETFPLEDTRFLKATVKTQVWIQIYCTVVHFIFFIGWFKQLSWVENTKTIIFQHNTKYTVICGNQKSQLTYLRVIVNFCKKRVCNKMQIYVFCTNFWIK